MSTKTVGIIVVVLVVAAGGGYLLIRSQSLQSAPAQQIYEQSSGITDTSSARETEQVLAGNASKLYVFNKAAYDEALKSDKLVVLYYYANWCPICKEEVPKLYDAFNELTTGQVIGFRVNYNDSDTDDGEIELAKEHGVAYQHTKVFIKGGQRILKSPETWDKKRYLDEINKAL